MNLKHILFIGGGTAFGAIAAVVLMKATANGKDLNAEQQPPTPAKTTAIESGGKGADTPSPAKSDQKPENKSVLQQLADENPEIDLAEIEGRRDEFRDAMRERQMDRLTDKMAKWSAALGLDKGQQEKLLEIADSQFEELETLAVNASESGDPAAISESARRAMSIMSGRALEESMAGLLTSDQQETYQAFGEQQNQSRAEARTLRQLAGLQEDLMLTPEQRNDAYGILYESSMAEVSGNSDVSSMIESFASQAGMSVDPSLQGMISSLANRGLADLAAGKPMDRESMEAMATTAVAESIDKQVEQLRPVLTEGQLDLYRSQLEGRIGNLMQRGRSSE